MQPINFDNEDQMVRIPLVNGQNTFEGGVKENTICEFKKEPLNTALLEEKY